MEIRRQLRLAARLFVRSFRYLTYMEILFKLIGAVILFPLCEMMLHVALRFSNVYYIASQNVKYAFTQPLLLIVFIFIIILFFGFLSFEITCLSLAYQQAYFKSKVRTFQLIKVALQKSTGFLKPKNWILLPFLILLFPTLYYFLMSSSNTYTQIIIRFLSIGFAKDPLRIILLILGILLVLAAVISMFSFQFYLCSGKKSKASIGSSFRLIRQNPKTVFVGMLLWLAAVGIGIFVLNFLVEGLIRLGIALFTEGAIKKAVTYSTLRYVRIVLSFMNISFFSFASYAYVAGVYFIHQLENQEPTYEPLVRRFDKHARKHKAIAVLSLTASILLTVFVNMLMNRSMKGSGIGNAFFDNGTMVIAHRGVCLDCTENTIPAFENALDMRADYLEMDVQFSKDGEIVIAHDAGMNRCFGVKANIDDFTAEELSEIKSEYGNSVPTLREFFERFQDENIRFCIELKIVNNKTIEALANGVMDLIEEYELQDRCIIQSFNYKSLQIVKQRDENIVTGYILSVMIGMYYDLKDADFFSINYGNINERMVTMIHLKNKQVLGWTVNKEKDIQRMIDLGVDGIITDDPLKTRELIYQQSDPATDLIPDEIFEEEEESSEERSDESILDPAPLRP